MWFSTCNRAKRLRMVWPVVIPEETIPSLLPEVKSGNRERSIIVPDRACEIPKPHNTTGLLPEQ